MARTLDHRKSIGQNWTPGTGPRPALRYPVGPVRKTVDSAARKAPMNRKRRRTAAKARRGATPASTGASAFEAGDTLRKAQALHESGRFEDAAALYERILGQDPRRSDAFHRIGVDAVDKGAYGAGAALIRKAIEANPAVASYHVDPAPALEHQGRLEETVEACRRARLWQHRLPRLSGPPVDGQA